MRIVIDWNLRLLHSLNGMLDWPEKTIYFAFVHPHLLFGVEIYANTGITHLLHSLTL